MSDAELLQDYVRHRSETAFATLVERHVNLVYSAARRQVRSPHLAEDVAQAVFVELSRQAARIPPAQPLAAWLYVVTRRTAIDAVRHESRRLARETTAAEIAAMKTPSPTWARVEETIDEAMASLPDRDRTALLLRFFQNQSLREVGAALGASDDAAQKRISRALDQLRDRLVRGGIAVTTTALAADLSAHALQTAPTGLGAAISSASALAATATAEVTRTLAMTTLQKSLVAAALVALGSTGFYEATLAARQADAHVALDARMAGASAEIAALRRNRDDASRRLQTVEKQIDDRLAQAAPRAPGDAALEAQMTEWLGNLDKLKRFLAQRPELNSPELQLLTPENWFTFAAGSPARTDEEARKIIARLRNTAQSGFSNRIASGLRAYLRDHDDTLPDSPLDLASYIDPPLDRAVLERFEMHAKGKVNDLAPADRRNVIMATPVDVEFDSLSYLGPTANGSTSALGYNLTEAMKKFSAANSGQAATTAVQLRPYLVWPVRDEPVQKMLDMIAARRR